MQVCVSGAGYVGLSNAVLLAQHNQVRIIDIVPAKVDMLNARQRPIEDPELEHYLATQPLNLSATLDKAQAYTGADYVVIASQHGRCAAGSNALQRGAWFVGGAPRSRQAR